MDSITKSNLSISIYFIFSLELCRQGFVRSSSGRSVSMDHFPSGVCSLLENSAEDGHVVVIRSLVAEHGVRDVHGVGHVAFHDNFAVNWMVIIMMI